ncbi:unnamed protein product, partial [Effrenium voratum]
MSLQTSAVSYNSALAALARTARWEETIGLLSQMRAGHPLDFVTFNTIASGLSRRWQLGIALAHSWKKPAATGLRIIVEACQRSGAAYSLVLGLVPLLRRGAWKLLRSPASWAATAEETHPVVRVLDAISGLLSTALVEWPLLSCRLLRPVLSSARALRQEAPRQILGSLDCFGLGSRIARQALCSLAVAPGKAGKRTQVPCVLGPLKIARSAPTYATSH